MDVVGGTITLTRLDGAIVSSSMSAAVVENDEKSEEGRRNQERSGLLASPGVAYKSFINR